jgi:hypothetical protein
LGIGRVATEATKRQPMTTPPSATGFKIIENLLGRALSRPLELQSGQAGEWIVTSNSLKRDGPVFKTNLEESRKR